MNKKKEDQTDKKLITDLSSYLNYVHLVRKKRPKKLQKKVEEIIATEESIVNRIKKIESLDIEFSTPEKAKEIESKEDKSDKSEKTKSKEPLTTFNILQFLFWERRTLINFGTRTKTINFNLFGFKKEFSADGIVYWRQCYSDAKEHLQKQVNYALLHGWKDLDPEGYNTISTFNKFLNKFLREGEFLDRNKSVTENIKILDSFIEPFLKLSTDPNYKSILKESLFEVLFSNPDYKDNIRETLKILEELTDTSKRTLGFFNVILALYSIEFNRFVKHKDLLKHHGVEDIDFNNYDFSQKTLSEISTYMNKIDLELNEIENELFELKFVDNGLNAETGTDDPWVSLFNKLCIFEHTGKRVRGTPSEAPFEKNPFQSLFSDILRYLSRASQGFLAYYGNVLKGECEIGGKEGKGKKAIVFTTDLFKTNVHIIEEVIKDYEYMKSSGEMIAINYDIYSRFVHRNKADIEKEDKMCRMIQRLIDNYKDIATKMVKILQKHDRASQTTANELLEKFKNQNDAIESIGKERLIPFAFETIVYHRYLDKIKIIEVIDQIAFFTMNVIYIFRDNEILNRFSERDALVEKMETYLRLKSKVTN